MSRDFVVLGEEKPELALVSSLLGGGDGRWPVLVRRQGGRVVVSVEEPVFVEAAGEVERLLGARVGGPVWWVDVRGAADGDDGITAALDTAEKVAGAVGGTVWSAG
ncbi:hypothetical protein [Actinocorallia lasiicapitis]